MVQLPISQMNETTSTTRTKVSAFFVRTFSKRYYVDYHGFQLVDDDVVVCETSLELFASVVEKG